MTKIKNTFDIDKDIEVPDSCYNYADSKAVYPFDDMEVGESFFVPKEVRKPKSVRDVASKRSNSMFPKLFSTRTIRGLGTRVWRIK